MRADQHYNGNNLGGKFMESFKFCWIFLANIAIEFFLVNISNEDFYWIFPGNIYSEYFYWIFLVNISIKYIYWTFLVNIFSEYF